MSAPVLTPAEARIILAEHYRRTTAPRLRLVDDNFPKQAAFLNDPATLKAGFCTRRAGKSYGAGFALCDAAINNPGVSCLYIALTRDSAKNILYKDVLKAINRRYGLGAVFTERPLTVRFPNGSVIYLLGMDSNPKEAEKALGQKFKVVVIDESASFRQNLRNIVYKILKPACADLHGQILMIGTPSNLVTGLFYDVVWEKSEPGWSVHSWSALDNPYMREAWLREISEIVASHGESVRDTPWFKQMYLGEYVVDKSKLCYKFDRDKNSISLADIPSNLSYVLGVDLGWTDPSAFALAGFNQNDTRLFYPEVYQASEMTLAAVAEKIRYYQMRYNPYKIVIDNANKQAVEEMKSRYGLSLTPADKTAKTDFIELMNGDFITGRIQLAMPECETLAENYEGLIWTDPKQTESGKQKKREEHPSCPNHIPDAALYSWRECYNYLSVAKPKELAIEEKIDLFFDQEAERMEAEANQPFWERV